jgi:hypothetical protein
VFYCCSRSQYSPPPRIVRIPYRLLSTKSCISLVCAILGPALRCDLTRYSGRSLLVQEVFSKPIETEISLNVDSGVLSDSVLAVVDTRRARGSGITRCVFFLWSGFLCRITLTSFSECGLLSKHITFWFGSVPHRPNLLPATLNVHVHLYSFNLVGSIWYERVCVRVQRA